MLTRRRKVAYLSLFIVFIAAGVGFAGERATEKVRIAVSSKSLGFLEQQGKADLPVDRVVDASVVDEVLRERR